MAKKKKRNSQSNNGAQGDIKNKNNKTKTELPDKTTAVKPPQFPFLLRRFAEMLALAVICSAPVSLAYLLGLPRTVSLAYKVMGLSAAAFVLANIYFLRAFFYSMGNKYIYFKVNLTAYAMFTVLHFAVLCIFGDWTLPSVYSFIYMPAKVLNLFLYVLFPGAEQFYLNLAAAAALDILMFIVILAAPLEMYKLDKPRNTRRVS